ncbi:MAG: hypothetical protein DUD33_09740 [Coriobacteriaceae bacterium]|nr:MAG: hypothetical protein DUD33_09740 [Coriobacteriaceae bacterium]
MNPVIVIPSYWAESDAPTRIGEVGVYDHATPITKPVPELATCLDSLEGVRGVLRVIVLLVCDQSCEKSARARVEGICRQHPRLNPLVIGSPEAALIRGAIDACVPGIEGDPVSLRGYGAIRNMGLAVAAVLNHDIVVFLDDDEVALNENFLIDAVYGMGMSTRQGLKISAKSGLYLDQRNSPYADIGKPRWSERYWSKRVEFNHWMHRALSGTRISRSNTVCGGCFCVGASAFTKVSFDPTISRGEDLDYLFNLRMHGFDVWFDNAWRVRHMPPKTPSHASRFMQDVFRWNYEVEKLRVANSIKGMRQVRPESLRPYPSDWISPTVVRNRIAHTSLRRAVTGPERLDYLKIWLRGRKLAEQWAKRVARSYFSFQTYWPQVMSSLWDSRELAQRLEAMGTTAQSGEKDEGTGK